MNYEYKKEVSTFDNCMTEERLNKLGADGWKIEIKEGNVYIFMREAAVKHVPLYNVPLPPKKKTK